MVKGKREKAMAASSPRKNKLRTRIHGGVVEVQLAHVEQPVRMCWRVLWLLWLAQPESDAGAKGPP